MSRRVVPSWWVLAGSAESVYLFGYALYVPGHLNDWGGGGFYVLGYA